MKKRIFLLLIVVILLLIPTTALAFAEEVVTDDVVEKTSRISDIADWFNNNFMTWVMSLIAGGTGLIAMIIPLLRSMFKNRKLQGAYLQQKQILAEQKELITSLSFTKEELKTFLDGLVASKLQEIFHGYDDLLSKNLREQKIIAAQNAIFIEAAKIAWAETEALPILSQSPTATLLKQNELEKEKLKQKIAEKFGIDTDDLTVEMEAVYDKFSPSEDL